MKIQQEFTLNHPLPDLWKFFHDVPAVASCLPGAEYLGTKDDGKHSGRMAMKVGPFQAQFDGEAAVTYLDDTSSVNLEAKGIDKKGGSRGKMTMGCHLVPVGETTKISVDADVQLSGAIAQFGRTGIIQEIAAVLIQDFVRNVDAKFSAPPNSLSSAQMKSDPISANASAPISGTRLLLLSLKSWLRGILGKNSASRS